MTFFKGAREKDVFEKLILPTDDFHKPGIRHFAELKSTDSMIAVIKFHSYFEKDSVYQELCPYFLVSREWRNDAGVLKQFAHESKVSKDDDRAFVGGDGNPSDKKLTSQSFSNRSEASSGKSEHWAFFCFVRHRLCHWFASCRSFLRHFKSQVAFLETMQAFLGGTTFLELLVRLVPSRIIRKYNTLNIFPVDQLRRTPKLRSKKKDECKDEGLSPSTDESYQAL